MNHPTEIEFVEVFVFHKRGPDVHNFWRPTLLLILVAWQGPAHSVKWHSNALMPVNHMMEHRACSNFLQNYWMRGSPVSAEEVDHM